MYTKNGERYRKDDEEIQKQAQELEAESHIRGRQALRSHFGEVFLEICDCVGITCNPYQTSHVLVRSDGGRRDRRGHRGNSLLGLLTAQAKSFFPDACRFPILPVRY